MASEIGVHCGCAEALSFEDAMALSLGVDAPRGCECASECEVGKTTRPPVEIVIGALAALASLFRSGVDLGNDLARADTSVPSESEVLQSLADAYRLDGDEDGAAQVERELRALTVTLAPPRAGARITAFAPAGLDEQVRDLTRRTGPQCCGRGDFDLAGPLRLVQSAGHYLWSASLVVHARSGALIVGPVHLSDSEVRMDVAGTELLRTVEVMDAEEAELKSQVTLYRCPELADLVLEAAAVLAERNALAGAGDGPRASVDVGLDVDDEAEVVVDDLQAELIITESLAEFDGVDDDEIESSSKKQWFLEAFPDRGEVQFVPVA